MKALYESILDADFDINDDDTFIGYLKSKRWFIDKHSDHAGHYSPKVTKKGHKMFFDSILDRLQPLGHKLNGVDDCIKHAEDGDFMMAINSNKQMIELFWAQKNARSIGPLYTCISISVIPAEVKNRALTINIFDEKPSEYVSAINKGYYFNVYGNPQYYTISRDDFMKFEKLFREL